MGNRLATRETTTVSIPDYMLMDIPEVFKRPGLEDIRNIYINQITEPSKARQEPKPFKNIKKAKKKNRKRSRLLPARRSGRHDHREYNREYDRNYHIKHPSDEDYGVKVYKPRKIIISKTKRVIPRIMTPNFYQIGKVEEIPGGKTKSAHFKRVMMHKTLEIMEIEIRNGQNSEYTHPAQVIDLYLKSSYKQKAAYAKIPTNYEVVPVKNTVPSIWPRRPWDDRDSELSEDETSKLLARCRMLYASPAFTFTHSRRRPGQSKPKIRLPLDTYSTDSESDSSDDDYF